MSILHHYIKMKNVRNNYLTCLLCYLVVINVLGLVGLLSFMIEQKTKEIGIRKVLGASVKDISFILSKDFLRLIIVAFFIAAPVAWFLMNKWLQDFAYRTAISWWVFAVAVFSSADNNMCCSWISNNKSSSGKPGEKFENGIIDWQKANWNLK